MTTLDTTVQAEPTPAVLYYAVSSGPQPSHESDLEQFTDWLTAGGYASHLIESHYLPLARILWEDLPLLDEVDDPFELVKQLQLTISSRTDLLPSRKNNLLGIAEKLRGFMLFQRGLLPAPPDLWALPEGLTSLPEWQSEPIGRHLRLKQRNWPARIVQRQTRDLFGNLRRVLTFFTDHYPFTDWPQLSLRWLDEFIDEGLRRGRAPATVNAHLFALKGLCIFLHEEGYRIPLNLTRLTPLDIPHRLPRPLSTEQVYLLEQTIQAAVDDAENLFERQQASLNQACFYLLWHCGLRIGEVQHLSVSDIDLVERKLVVRASKAGKDRVVYLSETTLQVLQQYLAIRPERQATRLFTHRHRPLSVRALERRLKEQGQTSGIAVTPHRLRHTFASQMISAGMPVTSLQRYLGHENIDTTMIYAEVSDPCLQADYYRGVVSFDPASASLAPEGHKKARRAKLQQHLAELKRLDIALAKREAILAEMQTLLTEGV